MTGHAPETQTRITSFWNARGGAYDDQPGHGLRTEREHAAWLTALQPLLPPPPADVLDIGTGTGFLALLCAEFGHRVTGIDPADGMLDAARRKAAGLAHPPHFQLGDGHAPPFPPGSFTVVASRHLLWTLTEPEQAFAAWFTLLRPGGRLLAIDGLWNASGTVEEEAPTDQDTPETTWEQTYAAIRGQLPLSSLTTLTPIVELLQGAGFTRVAVSHLADIEVIEREQLPAGATMPAPRYVLTAERP